MPRTISSPSRPKLPLDLAKWSPSDSASKELKQEPRRQSRSMQVPTSKPGRLGAATLPASARFAANLPTFSDRPCPAPCGCRPGCHRRASPAPALDVGYTTGNQMSFAVHRQILQGVGGQERWGVAELLQFLLTIGNDIGVCGSFAGAPGRLPEPGQRLSASGVQAALVPIGHCFPRFMKNLACSARFATECGTTPAVPERTLRGQLQVE